MIEKLLENWLDSASERSYQPVFVQMLAAGGYTVLHSTRHCLLEFGKDVLAVAPDGVGCAFQLKGDPRGRMTVGAFRGAIQEQLGQLMSQAPAYPGFPKGAHRSYLVSNGQFEEEVQTSVDQMNKLYPSRVELWSRGTLLEMCRRHGDHLWPSELQGNRSLLELYMADPNGPLPASILAGMLTSVLGLEPEIDSNMTTAQCIRSASSAAWLTGISVARFAEVENHGAVVHAWTTCCISLLGAAERHLGGDTAALGSSFALAQEALFDALAALWDDVGGRTTLAQGNRLVDSHLIGWRTGCLRGLLTGLAIADEERALLDSKRRAALRTWLDDDPRPMDVWGEGAIANAFPWLLWRRRTNPTLEPDRRIQSITQHVVSSNQRGSSQALATPYYAFDTVFRMGFGMPPKDRDEGLEEETFAGASFVAQPLLHLVARLNMKQACKKLWPDFTKLSHRRQLLEIGWRYCLLYSSLGIDETRLYPSTFEWKDLRAEARTGDVTPIPVSLSERAWLLSLWLQVAPHRLNSSAAAALTTKLLSGWDDPEE